MNKKSLFLITMILAISSASAKTCKAFLNGELKHQQLSYEKTKVIYPDGVIREAHWDGNVVTKKFIAPSPIEITCGTPWLMGYFAGASATGMMPPYIKTIEWTGYNDSGELIKVAPTTIYGFGSGGDYPYPSFVFKNDHLLFINEPTPAGQDICEMSKIDITTPVKFFGKIDNDPTDLTKYSEPYDGEKSYKWDPTSNPTNETIELELENPYVIISCDSQWKYELDLSWPYIVPADHDSLCGPAELQRNMKINGEFSVLDEKITGYMQVSTPTVTSSGSLTAYYTGAPFSISMNGKLVGSGTEKKVILPLLDGGDAFGFHFTATCPWGSQSYHVDHIGSFYLKLINENENYLVDDDLGGAFQLNADGEEDTFVLDRGGEQIVTIKRKWTKL